MKQYVVCMLCLLSVESIAFSQSRRGEAPGAMPAEPAATVSPRWPTLEEVLADLEQGDSAAKRLAVRQLLNIWPRKGELDHDEGLRKLLKELMHGSDEKAAYDACIALGKMDLGTLAIALEALRSTKQKERIRGLWLLQQVRLKPTDTHDDIEPTLSRLEELLLAADYHERKQVIYALSSFGERADAIVVSGLDLPYNQGGEEIVENLKHRVERVLPALIAALEGNDKARQLNTLAALEHLPDTVKARAAPAIIRLLKSEDYAIQQRAVLSLSNSGPLGHGAAAGLIELAEDGNVWALKALERVTIEVGDVDRVVVLLANANDHDAISLINALVSAGPEATPKLTAALDIDSMTVRERVMRALSHLGPAAIDAAPALREHFEAGDMKAAWALACITPTDQALAEKLVAKFAEAEWNGDIIGRSRFQSDALQPLIRMHDHVVPVILKGLSNDNHSVRYGCLRAIAPLQGEELKQAIPALRALLSESKVEGPRIPPGGTANSPPHRTPARMMFEERAQIVFSVPRGPEFTVDEYLEFLTELKRGADPEVVELVDSQINYVNRTKKEDMERTLRYLGPSPFGF
jgi:hypothetical protein